MEENKKEEAQKDKKKTKKQDIDNVHEAKPEKGVSTRTWHLVLFVEAMGIPDGWEPDIEKLFGDEKVLYACWSRERGEETKAEHYHIYIHMQKKTYRYTGIQAVFKGDPSLNNTKTICCQAARCGAEFNRNYIHHEGKHIGKQCEIILKGDYGDINKCSRGKRNDLSEYEKICTYIIEDIKNGETDIKDLISKYPAHFIRNYTNIDKIYNLLRNLSYGDKMKEYAKRIQEQENRIKISDKAIKRNQLELRRLKQGAKERAEATHWRAKAENLTNRVEELERKLDLLIKYGTSNT